MMELLKKHIHMNRRRGNVTSQMTLDDDFNVPDSMDDVEELILENGEIKIEAVKNPGEKAEISGKLEFRILYRRPGGELTALAGSIPFTETVHMPGLAENVLQGPGQGAFIFNDQYVHVRISSLHYYTL